MIIDDLHRRNDQTSLICMLHIFQNDDDTDDDVEFIVSSSLSNKSKKVKY